MKNNVAFIFRQGVFFTTVLLTLYSCTENNKQQPNIAIKKDSMVPPRVIVLANLPDSDKPRVNYLDKVPKPLTLVNPRTSVTRSFINPITHTVIAPEAQGIGFFTNYNTEQGLTLDGVDCGYCDRAGNLWFGTQGGGASRYDGKAFTNFTVLQGLADFSVNSITQDKSGNIWFATNDGASRFDGRAFTNFTTADGLANNQVTIIREDKSGNLWFGTRGGGISRYDGKSFTNFTTKDGLVNNFVFSIAEDKSGNIWFGTINGASRYDGKSFINFTTKDGLANNLVNSITVDKAGNIWLGTLGGVSMYDGKSFTNFTTKEGLVNNRINDIAEDKSGNLWFATLSGVTMYNGKSFISYTEEQGLPNNDVQSITQDKSGNLWFGTLGGGVSRYDGESIVSFTKAQGLTNNIVFAVAKDKSGNLWFGTDGGGLLRYDGKSFTNFNASHWIQNNSSVLIITQDKSGNLWFGSSGGGGVTRYDGKSFTRFSTVQGLAGNSVSCITEDQSGNLWFSTGNGLSCYDGKSFTNFTTKQGLIDNNIQCSIKDKKANLWFGTVGGDVSRYDGKSFTNFTSAQGLPKAEMLGIMEDKSGNLWFATAGGGVSRYDGKSFTNFTTLQGLADNTVYCETIDNQGNIVFGTNLGFTILKGFSPPTAGKEAGLHLIEPSNNLSNAALKSDKPIFEIYNQNTGYPIKDLNSGGSNGAILCDSSGIIWAGTGEKLIRFDYSAIPKSMAVPSVFIQSIKIDNEDISWYDLASSKKNAEDSMAIINEEVLLFGNVLSDSVREKMNQKFGGVRFDSITKWYPIPENLILPHEHNSITFEFGARELARGKLVKYKYFLKGYDKDWSPVSKRTSAGFSNIYEGTYTFQLKAQSPDGVWSEPITYTFKVLPPWYRTWWAYSLYVLLIVFTGLAIGRWQRHRVIANERQLAEIREAKLKAEAENERRKNIELISEIGKDITGSLSVEHIINTVYLHVNKLMDASVFGIGIYNKDRQYLEFPATKEKGQTLPAYSYGLSDKNRPASWCFNNKKEIFMNDFEKEHQDYIEYIPAAAAGDNTASVIYLPLVNKDKNIGVITAQSFVKNAYTDFHLEILRSIATYTALALDNADAYRELKSTQTQLIQSEKMASLGELTAGIAHEIQNPLNFVNNFSEVNKELLAEMKDEMDKGNIDAAKKIASSVIDNEEKINHHGKRAGDIVKGMLQHSRSSTGVKEPTDINALADEYLRLSYHGLRAKDKDFNATMKTDFDESIGKINIIPQDIGGVLLNLYNNAFYAVNQQKSKNLISYEPTVSVTTKKSENHVIIIVSDNGNGIPPKIVDKIFQPFFTTKPTGQGTGLGLSLSYDIVKAHGGELKVETKEGAGSTFIIQLTK